MPAAPGPAPEAGPDAVPALPETPSVRRLCACGGSCPRCDRTVDDTVARIALPEAGPAADASPPGLRIGAPGDRFELEADRVAERVMSMPVPSPDASPADAAAAPALQRKPLEARAREAVPRDGEEAEEEAYSEAPSPSSALAAPPDDGTPPDSGSLTRGGTALAPWLRLHFESRFGRDLASVRVHLGPEAARLCAAFHAHAFTYGSHIWLGRGHTPGPTFLMAHELAHVVQQRQPARLPRSAHAPPAAASTPATASQPAVRRLNLSLPFWVPLTRGGMMTGTAIHERLLGRIRAQRGQVDVEVPAPNAERSGFGINFKGRIDLFRGMRRGLPHAIPGLYFAGGFADTGQIMGSSLSGKVGRPTHHPFAWAGGTYSPRVLPGSRTITRITLAPETAEVGELKPADREILSNGEQQLNNYRQGLADASRQTNAWSRDFLPRRPQWNLKDPTNLPPQAVNFGAEYEYTPGGTPGAPYNLTLAVVEETPYEGAKYRFKPLYGYGEQPIEVPGGLYAGAYRDGMWVYFARPRNLGDAFAQTRYPFKRNQMVVANQVQDQIINDMWQAPQMVGPKPLSAPATAPVPSPAAEGPTVRFRKPLAKIEDHFKFPVWKRNFKAIRATVHSRKKEDVHYNKVLKFLELAYKAEENLGATPVTGKSSLPDKAKDPLHIQSNPPPGPGGTKPAGPGTILHKPLADIHSWLFGWTSPPVEWLGRFRSKVGRAFVTVADKLAGIRKKLRATMKGAFNRHGGGGGGGGLAGAVVRIMGRILVGLVRLWAPHAIKLTVHTLMEGVKKKLKKELELTPEELLSGAFKARLWKWEAKLTEYRTRAEAFLDDAVAEYGAELRWVKDAIDTAQNKVGPALEGIIIGVQCATPPIIGCLKMILRSLQNWAIEKVLGRCDVRREMAGIVDGFDMVKRVPQAVARKILGLLRKAAPSGFEEVFDEPVPDWKNPDGEGIDCDEEAEEDEEQPPPSKETPEPTEDQKAIGRLLQKHGGRKLAALGEMAERMGLPSDTVLLEEFTARLDTLLDHTRATPEDLRDMAEGKAAPEVKQRLAPLADHLEERRKAALAQAAEDLRAGKLDRVFRRMEQEGRQWDVLGDGKIRDGSPRKVVARHGKESLTGIARIDHGPCEDGRIMLVASQPELQGAKGRRVDLILKDQEFPGDRVDPPCLREPAPPKPRPDEEGIQPPMPAEEGGETGQGGEGGEPGEGEGGGKPKPRLEEGEEPGNKPVEVEDVPKPRDEPEGRKPAQEPGPGTKPGSKGPEGPVEEVEPEKPEGKEPRQGVPPPKEEIEEEGGQGPGPAQPPSGPQGGEPAGQEGGSGNEGGSQGGGSGPGGTGTGQGRKGRKGRREKVDPRKKGRIPPPPPRTQDPGVAHFTVCDWMDCAESAYPVIFEPQGEKGAAGWYVQTGQLVVPRYEESAPGTKIFMLYPRNRNAILARKRARDGTWEVHWVRKRQGLAGKAVTSPLNSKWIELVSGEAYDSLQEALKAWLRKHKIKAASTRIHLE